MLLKLDMVPKNQKVLQKMNKIVSKSNSMYISEKISSSLSQMSCFAHYFANSDIKSLRLAHSPHIDRVKNKFLG